MGVSQTLQRGTKNGITELSLVIFNRGCHLYSKGGHHVGHKPTFQFSFSNAATADLRSTAQDIRKCVFILSALLLVSVLQDKLPHFNPKTSKLETVSSDPSCCKTSSMAISTPSLPGKEKGKRWEEEQEGQHPLTGQRAPPISGGT